VLTYAFRVFRIVIIIFSVSYFIGIGFYILTWLIDDAGIAQDGENFFSYEFSVGKFRDLNQNNEDSI
jgi:hypothetical protein